MGRRRDGVTIVAAEEYERTLKGGREIKSGVSVSLTGCPLSKVTDHNSVRVFPLQSVCRPGRYKSHVLDHGREMSNKDTHTDFICVPITSHLVGAEWQVVKRWR